MNHRRVKLLKVSCELLIQAIGIRLCPEGYRVQAVGLPADAEIVNVRMGETFGFVYLVVTSEEFPELKEGELVPRLEVAYTKIAIGE